jgi:hypothetical protein
MIVCGADHGPRVDVVQLAPSPRLTRAVTDPHWKANVLACQRASGDGSKIPCWEKRQFAQNVGQLDHIHDLLWNRQVKELGTNSSTAWPPRLRHGDSSRTASPPRHTSTPSQHLIREHTHFEHPIHPTVPAFVYGLAE